MSTINPTADLPDEDYIDKTDVECTGTYTFVTVTRNSINGSLTVRHAVNAGSPNVDNAAERVVNAHTTATERVNRDWDALTGGF